jgi:V/A-type H+-transporting ATPase subunit A
MYCTPERQIALMRIILTLYHKGRDLIQRGVPLKQIRSLACVLQILRAKSVFSNTDLDKLAELELQVKEDMDTLAKDYIKEATFDVDMHTTLL